MYTVGRESTQRYAYLNPNHLILWTMAMSKGSLNPSRLHLHPETWTLCMSYKHGRCTDILLLFVKYNELISSEASVRMREETEAQRE